MLYQTLLLSCVLATAAAVQCSRDDECTQAQFCLENKCEDPCKDGCGIPNTICEVEFHRPVCSPLSNIGFNATTGGCNIDDDCLEDQFCVNKQCEDPCKDDCRLANSDCTPKCSYIPAPKGDTGNGWTGSYKSVCKTAFTSDYDYKEFLPLPSVKITGNTNSFIFRFKVKTDSAAHILLSTIPYPTYSDPACEIVLGGWANRVSVIRPRHGKPIDGGNRTATNTVSAYEMRGFWIKKYQDQLAVGVEGSVQPIMQGKDPHSANYKYFSFSSYDAETANWMYSCKTLFTEMYSTPN